VTLAHGRRTADHQLNITDLGMTVRDVAIHTKNGSTWAAPPAKPQLRDGVAVKDDAGIRTRRSAS
jgi:hypothetical protein